MSISVTESSGLLHIVSVAPSSCDIWKMAISAMQKKQRLLLIEDAVYAVDRRLKLTPMNLLVLPISVYLIEADILARSVSVAANWNAQALDYPQMVELIASSASVKSWY